MASLSPFLAEHIAVPEIRALVEESFGDFFRRNVAQYAGSSSLPVHCVGSVAYFYREPLERAGRTAFAAARNGPSQPDGGSDRLSFNRKQDMTFVKITEQPSSHGDLDKMSVRELLEGINDEDARVAPAVRRTIPQLEKLVTAVVERMRRGGRIFYLGPERAAGSRARRSEIPPTFACLLRWSSD